MRRNVSIAGLVVIITLVLILSGTSLAQSSDPTTDADTELDSYANIVLTYSDNWSPAGITAMEYAADIWSSVITSSQTIEIHAIWDPYEGGHSPGFIAGTYVLWTTGAPVPGTWYPIALVEALREEQAHVNTEFSTILKAEMVDWYLGTDGQCPSDQYDLVTVALKLIGMGLGIKSDINFCDIFSDEGCYGEEWDREHPYLYDTFVVNGAGQHLTDLGVFPNPSLALGTQLTSNDIYFDGPLSTAANGGEWPKLYAPSDRTKIKFPFLLDDASYPRGDRDALMTHTLEPGEAIHEIGPLALAMLYDMGWPHPPQAPTLDAIPTRLVPGDIGKDGAVDLWRYVHDLDTLPADQTFVISDTVPAELGASMDGGRYIDLFPTAGWTGEGTVTVQVTDPDDLQAETTFRVIVADPLYHCMLPITIKQ